MRISCLNIVLFAALHTAYGREVQGINNSPDALRFIRSAETVNVLHMRLLGPEARDSIVQLLGNEDNWWHGLAAIAVPEPQPTNIGLLFRSGKDELVLFFDSEGQVEGKFRGTELGGLLEHKPRKEFEDWKRRYAQPELGFK